MSTHAATQGDVAAFLNGDEGAFARLWERFKPGLLVLIAGRVRSSLSASLRSRLDAEAEDILHDCARTAFTKLKDFEYRGPGSLLAWMSRIAEHAVKDRVSYWLADKRRPDREVPFPWGGSTGSSTSGSPASALEDRNPGPSTRASLNESISRVTEALAGLSEREHTIVHLRFFADASWAEIAGILGDPDGASVQREFRHVILPVLGELID